MHIKEQTSKEYFKGLAVVHGMLLLGQVVFGAIALFVVVSDPLDREEGPLNDIFQIVAPLLVIGGLLGSTLISRSRLKSIKLKTNLKEKLGEYRSTLIIKFVFLEAPFLFAIVCFIITANHLFLALAGFLMLVFVLNRPTKNRAVMDMELSHADRLLIENPNSIVAEVEARD